MLNRTSVFKKKLSHFEHQVSFGQKKFLQKSNRRIHLIMFSCIFLKFFEDLQIRKRNDRLK